MGKNFVKVTSVLAIVALALAMAFPAMATTQTTNNDLQQTLVNALQEERLAAATYQAIIDKFGEVKPFTNIIEAEKKHIAAVENLMKLNGVPIPTNTATATAPKTLQDAYEIGIKVEKEDIALYDELIPQLNDSMVKSVFTRLSNASERHLNAFERYANGEEMNAPQGQVKGERYMGKQNCQSEGGRQMLRRNSTHSRNGMRGNHSKRRMNMSGRH